MSTTTSHNRRPISVLHFTLMLLLLLLLISNADAQSELSAPPAQYTRFNNNFSPSMAVLLVVLISAFFFMGFFSVYIRQCYGDVDGPGGMPNRGGPIGGRSRRSAARGLDPEVIEMFPMLVYSDVKGLKIGKGTLECAVCLSEFEDAETIRLLPKCCHVFHPDCINGWLAAHTTCPVCRFNLVPDPNAPPGGAAYTLPAADPAPGGEEVVVVVDAAPEEHVAINIDEAAERIDRKRVDSVDLSQIGGKNRTPWRSRSTMRPTRFPRSHSTGHSVVQPGENVERFTLRLPEHVRRDVMAGRLNRSASCVAFPPGEGSSRRGFRGRFGEGSSRGVGGRSFKLGKWDLAAKSDRWTFLARTFSFGVPKAGDGEGSTRRGDGSTRRGEGSTIKKGGEGEGSARGKVFPSVEVSSDCLGGGARSDAAVTHEDSPAIALATKV